MVEKISIQIGLTGTEEIKRQLAGVSEAGKKCFEDISNAAAQAGGFDKLDPTVAEQKFKQFGITATGEINKINAALRSATKLESTVAGVERLEQSFNNAGQAATRATAAFGLTRREIGALRTGLRQLDLGPIGSQIAVLGRVGGAFGPLGIAITAIGAAIAGGAVAMTKFATAAEETEKALSQLQKVSGVSLENLSALSNVFARGGTKVKDFASEFGNLAEKIASAGEEANKQEAIKKQAEDAAKGLKVTELGAITLDERVKALLVDLSRAPAEQQWFRLADTFKNLGNEMERARLGKALGLSPETITTLSLGSAKLQEMAQQAKQLGIALDAVDQKNLGQLRQSQTEAGALFDSLKDKIGALVAPAVASFWQGFKDEIARLVPIFTQIAEQVGQLDFSRIGAAAADFLLTLGKIAAGWANIFSGNVSFGDVIKQLFATLGQELVVLAGQIGVSMGQELIKQLMLTLIPGARLVANIFAQAQASQSPGAPLPQPGGIPMAGGGLLGGRGTGTSDSNLAWLSRGEYITPARAVAQPGVLAFLEALRRSGGNLSRVLDGMGRFALGGMIRGPMPAFAAGGLAGGSNVTIQFPGLPAIGGLRASSDVVDQLHRAAALAQVRSGGRKPSRYS